MTNTWKRILCQVEEGVEMQVVEVLFFRFEYGLMKPSGNLPKKQALLEKYPKAEPEKFLN